MKGRIIKGIAGFYYVDTGESGVYECKAKGIFRKDKRKPLVGDDVEIEILEEEEKEGNLIMVGQLNLEKQIGRDTLADYKLYAENGRTLEHSIGVKAIKRDETDPCKVLEWKMFEYSTLTSWGSNPQTFLVNLKSGTQEQVKEAVEFIRKAFRNTDYSEERLKQYDMELNLLLKAINGGNVVTCPHCGHQFDYDSQNEVTFSQQVLENAAMYSRWLTDRIVSQEIDKLEPDVRADVIALIDSVKSEGQELTEKSVQNFMAYVRCPACYSRVYRSNALLQDNTNVFSGKSEPSNDTRGKTEGANEDGDVKKKAAESTSFFGSLNGVFSNND